MVERKKKKSNGSAHVQIMAQRQSANDDGGGTFRFDIPQESRESQENVNEADGGESGRHRAHEENPSRGLKRQ
jgi:hypothetical protein